VIRRSDREAKALKSDPSSWSQDGIARRAYRQMPLAPEEEVPRRGARRRRKKHVHRWGEPVVLREEVRRVWGRSWAHTGHRAVKIRQRTCKRCGQKETDRFGFWS